MDTDVEVLIAGAGPTGLLLANELGLAGVRTAVVERRVSARGHGGGVGRPPRLLGRPGRRHRRPARRPRPLVRCAPEPPAPGARRWRARPAVLTGTRAFSGTDRLGPASSTHQRKRGHLRDGPGQGGQDEDQ
ncbi:FAD-dependent monooxygenase [Streptomyces sp. bgisy130]|uniref:FAD-dependent monooxygenase n=1 Tax=Streptomyces sp. bgisy130 TaxID=3413788 RepID=UPI003F4A27C6